MANHSTATIEDLDQIINGLRVWHLALPVVSRRDHGIGSVADTMEVVILRLSTNDGLQGHGEASPWAVFTGTPEASYAAINRYFRPHLLGSRLGDLKQTLAVIQRAVVHCTEAKSAVESALFDLAGKALNKPVWALLGEKCRDSSPFSVSIANPDFAQDIALMHRLSDDGIGIVKLKTGFRDDDFDVMRMQTIRSDFPEFKLRIDYNQGLNSETALDSVRKALPFRPDFIEQPVVSHAYDTMAMIRSEIDVPLLADESIYGPEDMRRAIREGICDGTSIKVMKSGGMRRGIETASLAGSANLPAYGGDMFETGLAHLAGLHMLAVAPNISLGCEFYHSHYFLETDTLLETLKPVNGELFIPDEPGLGAELNEAVLEKYCLSQA
ncbi:MAG: muconate cycloisomerase [Gammaproteobacteria bacterium]|nr:muconate cycloisomerase [Rhizobiaceae bacterium]NKC14077.1 muconate cycloisomerase [Gammaproteobacteria bacterium]